MGKRINIGVVGTGYWGTKLIKEYHALSSSGNSINLYGICDVSEKRLTEALTSANLDKSEISMITTDPQDVFNCEEIDAVHIATPNATHYELALQALNNGKHVMLEKPMTISSREAFKLVREAEKRGLTLMVDHIFRFNNALKMAKEKVNQGEIGKIYYMKLNWSAHLQRLPKSDIIFDLAPHPVDIINYLIEEWPLRAQGFGVSYLRKDSEEVAFLTLEYPDNVMAQIELSWLYRGRKTRSVEIVGEKGVLLIDALRQRITLFRNENNVIQIPVKPNNTIRDMILHFIAHLLKGEPPLNSAHVGAMTVFVLENLLKSIINGKKVEIMR